MGRSRGTRVNRNVRNIMGSLRNWPVAIQTNQDNQDFGSFPAEFVRFIFHCAATGLYTYMQEV